MVLLIIIPMKNGYFIGNIANIFRQTHIWKNTEISTPGGDELEELGIGHHHGSASASIPPWGDPRDLTKSDEVCWRMGKNTFGCVWFMECFLKFTVNLQLFATSIFQLLQFVQFFDVLNTFSVQQQVNSGTTLEPVVWT